MEIFANNLFENNKCIGKDSRNAAYKLLFAICKGNPKSMLQLISKGITPLIKKLP